MVSKDTTAANLFVNGAQNPGAYRSVGRMARPFKKSTRRNHQGKERTTLVPGDEVDGGVSGKKGTSLGSGEQAEGGAAYGMNGGGVWLPT